MLNLMFGCSISDVVLVIVFFSQPRRKGKGRRNGDVCAGA